MALTVLDQASLDAWLADKIKTDLSNKPDPDWGGVFEMINSANDLPLTEGQLMKLYREAVEYGEHLNKEYALFKASIEQKNAKTDKETA